MDLSTFDFRTGKMLMSKMNRSRQRVRYDSSNQVKVSSGPRAHCSDPLRGRLAGAVGGTCGSRSWGPEFKSHVGHRGYIENKNAGIDGAAGWQ